MTLTFLFWFFMLLWFLLSVFWGYRTPRDTVLGFAPVGANFFVFVLLIIVGLKIFGSPISGGG